MAVQLKHFSLAELRLTQEQAWRVLRFFWPDMSLAPADMNDADRSFAQGLLVEAIDSSYDMSFVDHVFKSFYMKAPTSFNGVRDMVKGFAAASARSWFKHATSADLLNPQIYESVRRTLARNFRSVWKIREATGELTY